MSNAENWRRAVSFAEGTIRNNAPAYNVQFGGGTFDNSLPGHPNKVIHAPNISSAAAGAFQFMPDTCDMVTQNLPQLRGRPMDKLAQQEAFRFLLSRRGVDIDNDPINAETLARLAPEFASIPTLQGVSYYPPQQAKSVREIRDFVGLPYNYDPYSQESLDVIDEFSRGGNDGQGGPSEAETQVLYQRMKNKNSSTTNPVPEVEQPTADPELVKELQKEPTPVAVNKTDDRVVNELRTTQRYLAEMIKNSRRQSEEAATAKRLSSTLENARAAFGSGKSVI